MAREDRVRRRSRTPSSHRKRRQSRSRSRSDSAPSSFSSSSRSRSQDRRSRKEHRRSRKDKKRERRRRSLSSSSSDSSPKKRHHKKKKHHHKKDKKSAPLGAVTEQYGKYGIIRNEDQYKKRAEFLTWLVEVKGVDIEALSHVEERKLFEDFVEDFNTATMPSKKYYDIAAWEARQAAKKSKHSKRDNITFDDERSRAREIQSMREARTEEVTRQTFDVMKKDRDLVRAMKEQEDARNAVKYLHKAGHHDAAEKIADKLRPGEPEEEDLE
ncbi:U4/U6.U5 tri-snRNP-associated protein, putative [Perkinsus marinus ATCC 50983]|uniref:U4/U6.U5 tri-snRNP-associated protein, putative n=1 Tax=Perkinsus marinus (strain ATCC 50983 / TXsc) TaxID=423536 RepID=C5KYC2_PERM5|nr:U4/U6.U5 tri-snRNP-associated protein, putative [Perkinsus marinus ATCC 50983]EER10499.1 U4/U6.U5 tri-snRNP-associated protein, putative [Perkinsus marinus ATCC 50983]|eukprot:XP_002778704.1 U4/U6.U5 tri-snRNP-associated protein, putative [Perkinsus marinus ATCC 50983]